MAKFDQIESAVVSLDKQVKELTSDLQKLITVVNSNSKSQADLAKKTKAVTSATQKISGVEEELEKINTRKLKLTKEVIKAQELEKKRVKELREEVKKEIGVTKQKLSFTKKMSDAYATSLLKVTALLGALKGLIDAGKAYINNIKELNKNISQTAATFQLTREQAVNLTKNIRGLAAAFDEDFNDVLKSANILSKEFGLTGSQALKLIETGFKKGANINGEFLELLKEYPAQLKSIGLNAKQSIAIITQTEQAGLFSDKGIDAIKEAGIRLRELTPATISALNAIGLSGDEIQRQLETGEKSLFEVTQDVSAKLSELPPQSKEVGTAIADIFGGPGEDVGLRFLTTLKDIDLELNNIQSTLSPVEESSANLKRSWQGLKDEVGKGEGAASRFIAKLQNGIAQNTAFIGNLLNGFKNVREGVEETGEIQQEVLEDNIEAEKALAKKQAELAAARKAERDKEVNDNIERLKNELAKKLALEEKYRQQNSAEADALVDAELALTDSELNAMAMQLDEEYNLQLEADKEYLKLVQEKADEEKRIEKEKEDAIIAIKEAAIDAAGKIVSDRLTAGIDEDLARRQSAADAEQKILDDKLDKGLISEAEFTKESAKLDLKARQDSAKAEKKKASYSNAIDTVVAVAKTFATLGWPAGIIPAGVMAGIGVANGIAIASEPTPKFKHGSDGLLQYATDAIVGDGGERELITTPKGSYLSPAKSTQVHLPANSQVFSGADTKELLQGNEGNVIGLDSLIKEQQLTRQAIANQPKYITNLSDKGLETAYIKKQTRINLRDEWLR